MALERLVESYSFDSETFKRVASSHKITESELSNISALKLSEETKHLLEKDSGVTLVGKTVWRVPISRYDWKNANGRVYEKRLWQNVIDTQKENWQGGVGLADHPGDAEDGRFKEVAMVWLNMGLNEAEQIVWGECVFVGPYGKLAEEILEAGGKVGLSSSGFGELDESDKSTVRWDSYQIERLSDAVLNPSQKVYAKKENKVTRESIEEKAMNPAKEPKIKKCECCGREHDGKSAFCPDCESKNVKQESTTMGIGESADNSKMSRHEIRRFREDVVHYLGELGEREDLQEKLKELEEIRSYFSPGVASDLLAEVEKQITETRAAIDAAIKEHGKIAKTFGVDKVEELKEGVKRLAVDTQYYERDAADWKKITEGLQEKCKMLQAVISSRPTVEQYKTLLIQMKTMQENYATEKATFETKVKTLKEQSKTQSKIEEQLIVELETLDAENGKLREYSNSLKAYGLRMKEKLDEYREGQKALHEELEEKKIQESNVRFRPEATASTGFTGFNEMDEVQEYYENLEIRYGKDITSFKEKILACKTVREAMLVFNKAFVSSNRLEKVSEALEPEDRKRLIESATGTKIRKNSPFEGRLPKTWE